jgi:glycosyltransferase involved in cell wall biosynthesis
LIERIGVGPLVEFKPEVSHAELSALYSKAAGLVLPSSQESFGNPYLEAAAAGCPVVAAARRLSDAIRPMAIEVPAHSHAALAAAMCELLRLSDDERRHRSETLRAWAERFPWSRTLRETRDVLEEVV